MHRNNLRDNTRAISVMVFIFAHSNSDSYVSNDAYGRRRPLLNSPVGILGGPYRPGWVGVTGGEEDAAITALYQVYRAPLMSFVLRLTGGDRQHAEDIVQETMVRAWREAGRLDLSGPSLMPWLSAVARRIVIDEHRRKRSRPAESGTDAAPDLPVDDSAADTVLRVAVADALRQLTSSHRQAISETILRDQTASQAAVTLGIPVGTVKSRVHYALRVLEVVLAERGLGP
jgi:RNA polymerase sigma-70 factor, ECF subfamily